MTVEEGANSIEHGSYLDQDPDLFKLMADEGTFFVPDLDRICIPQDTRHAPRARAG